MTSSSPNVGLNAEDWAGTRGTQWLANLRSFESMLATPGGALLDHAAFQPGERVVDIGCGGGGTSLAIAQAVGPQGLVVGLDISSELAASATRRAADVGIANVRFEAGDAATSIPQEAPFDRLFSRFGCMFFERPYDAYANLHRMIRPGGRIDLGVWAPAKENGWMIDIHGVISRHVELPPPVPRAPGPCALDDPDYVRDLLGKAGFTKIEIKPWAGDIAVAGPGASPEEALRFALDGFSVCEPLADCNEATRQAAARDLLALFTARHDQRGVIMPAKIWIVTATA